MPYNTFSIFQNQCLFARTRILSSSDVKKHYMYQLNKIITTIRNHLIYDG